MKQFKFRVRKVIVSDLIDVLMEAEDDGIVYVSLKCTITKEQDSVSIAPYSYKEPAFLLPKPQRQKDVEITDDYLQILLNQS